MVNETDPVQNGSRKSPPENLPDGFIENDNSDDDNVVPIGQGKYQIVSNYSNDDKSNSYFINESNVFEDDDPNHSARVQSRLGDGGAGVQSRQPPRHHRPGNVTPRDHFVSDDGGSFNNKNTGSYLNPAGLTTAETDDVNNSQQPTAWQSNPSNTFAIHDRSADARQNERQRFLHFASTSPSNSTLSGWDPTSPNFRRNLQSQSLMPQGNVTQEQNKKLSRLLPTYLQPHQVSIDSYQRKSRGGENISEEQNAITPAQEIQSTIRIMDYSQRQRIRQRSQQSFHNHSMSQESPVMRIDQRFVNGSQARSLSAESDASPFAPSQFLQHNGSPFSGTRKQAPDIDGSASREKRSHSFDTAISMTSLDHEIGDIVDYSQYPNRTCDADEQYCDHDKTTSSKYVQKKRQHRIGHSRSYSTSDTIALGRRRNNNKKAVTLHSNFTLNSQQHLNTVHQPISSSRLNTASSFESSHSINGTAREWSFDSKSNIVEGPNDWNNQRKHRRQNRSSNVQTVDAESDQESRDGHLRFKRGENLYYDSDNSKSISDYEERNKSLFKRRMRDNVKIRDPSIKRKGNTISPFANIGKTSAEKAARSTFLPTSYGSDDKMYSTFVCPRCKTRQREFFTVENAAGRLEGPGSYLALYFAVYVTCSLFIFGLEEGWKPLDCIYFAVITLTTAGLGDFVPTSWVNKIICSIFIYFGVACIGLLLGSYIASMLDHRAIIDRKSKQIDACPNCARIKTMNEAVIARNKATLNAQVKYLSERGEKRYNSNFNEQNVSTPSREEGNRKSNVDVWGNRYGSASPAVSNSSSVNSRLLGSPVTRQILGRQKHTRHASIDVNTSKLFSGVLPATYGSTSMVKNFSDEMISNRSSNHLSRHGQVNATSNPNKLRTIASSENLYDGTSSESDAESTALSSSTLSSTEAIWDGTKSQLNAAKYVFITLRLALFNSMVIIAVGCVGFHLIEGFTLVDSWYFTTVLLTTVGYGDIVPVTDAGKLFATIYILVAGTLLLNNMSSISMIPLELRRRRIERAVLTQFGDHLDDAALRELATGPLVQRLRLSTNRTDGLDECTREMFSLAMLVRLGKVTEHDIRGTFSCFRHLDVNNEGVLNSKSIIAGMIAKQRQSTAQSAAFIASLPPPPPPPDDAAQDKVDQKLKSAWLGRQGSLHVKTEDNSYVFHPMTNQGLTEFLTNDEPIGLPLNES